LKKLNSNDAVKSGRDTQESSRGGLKRESKNPGEMFNLSLTRKKLNTVRTDSSDRYKPIGTKKWYEIEQRASLGRLMSGLPSTQCEAHSVITGIL
jgi:hypothetical protein